MVIKMDISVITFTLGGREKYLKDCILSVDRSIPFDMTYESIGNRLIPKIKVEHHIVFQGVTCPETIKEIVSTLCNDNVIIHEWPENIGIGAGLNKIIPQCSAPLIMKMDDDCKIISKDFFESALALHKRFPDSVFSPFPAGLIRSLGGVPGHKHSVWYDKENDKYYTRRHTHHIGGFARFAPKSIFDNFKFPNDLVKGISGTEDGDFSSYCNSAGITMFYLENGMIVEHNESGFGQIIRYPEYFSGRSWESTVKIEVIE